MPYLVVLYSTNKILPSVYSIEQTEDEVNAFVNEAKLNRMFPYFNISNEDDLIEYLQEDIEEGEEIDEEEIEFIMNRPFEEFYVDGHYLKLNRYIITDLSYFEDKDDYEITNHLKSPYTSDKYIAIFDMKHHNVRDIMKYVLYNSLGYFS